MINITKKIIIEVLKDNQTSMDNYGETQACVSRDYNKIADEIIDKLGLEWE